MKTKTCLFILLLSCFSGTSIADVIFGRLYTTPKQREQLDEARTRKPQGEIVIDMAKVALPETDATEEVTTSQSISLDGIVYRTDGKNTAWINRNSTNEGNLENQFTEVGENDVHPNQVKITLPDHQTRIELKVGEQYDVNSKEIHDTMKDPVTSSPGGQTETLR